MIDKIKSIASCCCCEPVSWAISKPYLCSTNQVIAAFALLSNNECKIENKEQFYRLLTRKKDCIDKLNH